MHVGTVRGSSRRAVQSGGMAALFANLDLILLLVLIVADIRVLQESEVASFTLFELFVWGYCAPFVVAEIGLQKRESLPPACLRFLAPLGLYIVWLLIVACLAIAFRADSAVLQDTKNVVPALVLVLFIFFRIRRIESVILLCNVYIVYSLLACVVGLLQFRFGAPYFRDLLTGTEYKLDIEGAVIATPVVGFSRHPNEFAMAIMPGVCLAVSKLFGEIRNRWRIKTVTVAVVMMLCSGMVLSNARGAMMFTAVAILFITSPLGKSRQFLIKFGCVAALTACIVLYGLHQANSGNAPGAETIETRYLLWQTTFKGMSLDNYVPWFGDGMNYVKAWSGQIAGWEFPDAHNAWIDQILYFGAPALLLYLAIWWQFFRLVEVPAFARPLVNAIILDALRATVMALMGDYFFEPVANAIFPISQLFLIMALAVRIVSLPVPEDVRTYRKTTGGPASLASVPSALGSTNAIM